MKIGIKHHVVLWHFGLFLLVVCLVSLAGCKKSEPEPSESSLRSVGDAVSEAGEEIEKAIEQKTCPVMMGNPINKDIFTEYKGKKVYFCCPECKPKFEANPEEYLAKLPQFKN